MTATAQQVNPTEIADAAIDMAVVEPDTISHLTADIAALADSPDDDLEHAAAAAVHALDAAKAIADATSELRNTAERTLNRLAWRIAARPGWEGRRRRTKDGKPGAPTITLPDLPAFEPVLSSARKECDSPDQFRDEILTAVTRQIAERYAAVASVDGERVPVGQLVREVADVLDEVWSQGTKTAATNASSTGLDRLGIDKSEWVWTRDGRPSVKFA